MLHTRHPRQGLHPAVALVAGPDDCKFSSGIYRSCSPDGQGRCASNDPFIFCSAVGACSFVCGSASDCQTSPSARASCMSSGKADFIQL